MSFVSARSYSAMQAQGRVLYALMLHDIKSRFFGNGLGYLVTMLWPLTHMAVVMGMMIFTGRTQPYGSSMTLYAATGVVPFIAFSYISRFTVMGVLTNRSYLQYPVVRPLDLMFSRIVLEIVSASLIVVSCLLVIALLGVDVMPVRPFQAALGLISAFLLGIGMGVLNGTIAMAFPFWNIAYTLLMILLWATCGVVISPESFPADIGYLFSFNPVLHCIEWIRSGYYQDYPTRLFSAPYVLSVSIASLGIGLIIERFARGLLVRP